MLRIAASLDCIYIALQFAQLYKILTVQRYIPHSLRSCSYSILYVRTRSAPAEIADHRAEFTVKTKKIDLDRSRSARAICLGCTRVLRTRCCIYEDTRVLTLRFIHVGPDAAAGIL